MAIDIAAGDVQFALAVDGVVAGGIGVNRAAGDGEGAFDLNGLALGAVGHDAAAAHLEIAAIEVAVAALFLEADLDGLAGHVVGLAAGGLDGEGAAGDVAVCQGLAVGTVIAVVAGAHTLSAGAAVGDGHAAARHAEVVVGLDAGAAGVFPVFAVVGRAAADRDGGGAALHQHIVVGGDALLHGRLGADVQSAVAQLHIFVGLDAVAGAGAGAHGHAGVGQHPDVVVGYDAALALGVVRRDAELVAAAGGAAEDKLSFREEHALHVLVGGGAVGGR